MITFKPSSQQLAEQKADGYIVFCPESNTLQEHHTLQNLTAFFPPLFTLLKQRGFKGGANSCITLSGTHNGQPVYLIIAGLGSHHTPHADRLENYRRAVGHAFRAVESHKVGSLALELPAAAWLEVDTSVIAKETVSILMMTEYHFDTYITDESRRMSLRNYEFSLNAPALLQDEIKVGIELGQRIGHAVNQARQWCDLPPVVLTPNRLGEHAQHIAQVHGLKCSIFNEEQIKKMGMGGLEAVAKGSEQEARFVVIEYKTDHPGAQTIALVGKGITFDSGGLSIKPATAMESMKDDMAGAAAVISTMEAIAHIKPRVNVIGLAPITENLISGHATKPGDIIQFYNGMTAEVKNTDAEGRLILADALSYAVKHYKLDAIINIATLTGSCAAALGPFFAGLMSKHPQLADKLLASAYRTGDRLWPLPLHDDFKKAIRSEVADLSNIGSDKYRAGTITAGFFLQPFVGNVPWVHLDVAGTSFNVPDVSYYRPGATGFGVRLFIDLVMNWE